ncbi:MAG: restriction endonuclease subunit S [Betaproteobacteria bacterium]|nr:restriction endonuclease subunit S [Betaproteobacteria bacterium]
MSKYKRFPAHKGSGVEWIGEVPEHWDVMAFKRLASIRNGQDYKDVADPSGAFPVIGSGGEFARASSYLFDGESVLLGRKGTIDRPLYINGPFWAVDTMFYTNISDDAFPKFVYYSALTIPFGLYSTNTALPSMTGEDISSHVVAAPKYAEQQRIANSLDRETARIDALIAKKTRFIELLKEKRQALITHAVTKGLNPKAKMKDSGVEWIGDVPAHWQIRRVATLFREAIRPGDPDLPILSISIHDGITDDELAPEDRDRRVSQIEDRTKYKRVAPGDLAYNMMRAWQGAFGAVTVDGLVSPAYVVAEPADDFRTAYIEHLLRTSSAIEEMRRYSRGIADFRMRLYWDYFRDLKVCLPPEDEQNAILDLISAETRRIDLLTVKTQYSIDLLKERRSAFITAAVTGQIDLREVA